MKTAEIFKYGILAVAITGLTFTGCKKDKNTETAVNTQSLQQLSKDEVTATQISDDALNDANTVLSNSAQLKSTETLWPCNATIDSTSVVNDSITFFITYNGDNCSGTKRREGQVTITKKYQQPWGQQGATAIVHLINLKITKNSNGKWMTLNGTKTFTNVSGGYLWMLGNTMNAIVHKVVGSFSATFDDSTTRVWSLNRQRTFTGTLGGGQLVMTVDGLGSADGYNNLSVWGVNRNGENFYTRITQPVVFKGSCDWDPVSGVKIYQIPSDDKKATVTYGYDSNYNLVTNGDCPTYFRVDWQKNTHSGTFFLPLP
jgi:hypothetical protein